jgi:hypothetical protein
MSKRKAERLATITVALIAVFGGIALAELSPPVAVVWLGIWIARAV